MEDNDLRGFVDGRYVAAWNQPSQTHVRIGRKPTSWAKHGDCELFRLLHRWDEIWLPEGSSVLAACLEVEIERGVERDLEVFLYEVFKDWEPGSGGMLHNNNSAPARGEVWWNEAARGVQPWGLPGAGFASDRHPDADTPEMPLAIARYRPGDSHIRFDSTALAAYIEKRIAAERPLLFLLKLSDYLEDIPGTSIDVYSANHGDTRNTARRPKLTLDWSTETFSAATDRHVLLEHGRSTVLPRIEAREVHGLAVSFIPENREERPLIFIRGGRKSTSSDWIQANLPRPLDWNWIEVRLDANHNPLPFGQAFTAEIRDTWVPSGPKDEQEVPWTFFSPGGRTRSVLATYAGNSRWRVNFLPDELGRWQYVWSQNFTKRPFKSAVGTFDVVPGDLDNASDALKSLMAKANGSDVPPGKRRGRTFSVAFNRLLRGIMRLETPESFPLAGPAKALSNAARRIDDAREAIGGSRPRVSRMEVDEPEGVDRG